MNTDTMNTDNMKDKKKRLRKQMRSRIHELSEEEMRREAEATAVTLFSLAEWSKATTVLVFISMSGEIGTDTIIRRALSEGKKIALPKMHGKEMEFHLVSEFENLEKHPYGVREPSAEEPLFDSKPIFLPALVVTPGLAFDRRGRRLGRGKAFYDRWFSRHAELLASGDIAAVGVGFSVQLIDEVPAEERDFSLSELIIAGTHIPAERR